MKNDLECLIEEDPLIHSLIESEGKQIDVIAFGISYSGTLEKVDIGNGYIVVTDDEDTAVLELERISSFKLLD
jgi:hypothetical protein